jgi:hypothetical protein
VCVFFFFFFFINYDVMLCVCVVRNVRVWLVGWLVEWLVYVSVCTSLDQLQLGCVCVSLKCVESCESWV